MKIGGDEVDDTEFDKADQVMALRFLAEQKKQEVFRDKSKIELENVAKQAHHTRTKIRVKFPDGYIL